MEETAATFLPVWLNLDSLSIIRLAALLLSLVICSCLFRVPRRSLATLFLAGAFLGAVLFNTASFFEFARPYYWQRRTLKTVLVLLFIGIGLSLATAALDNLSRHGIVALSKYC